MRKFLGRFIEWALSYEHEVLIEMDHDEAKIPTQGHPGEDAGYDIYVVEDVELNPKESKLIDTGIKVCSKNKDLWFHLVHRSSIRNIGLTLISGTMDMGYTNKWYISVYNHSDSIVKITKGQRLAQLIPFRPIQLKFKKVDNLHNSINSKRGLGGFGSSGTH